MRTATMGRVVVSAKIENILEVRDAQRGLISPNEVHRLEVDDALIDTGSTYLAMPKSKLKLLGFTKSYGTARTRTAKGVARLKLYGPVRLNVQGRFCTVDIAEIAAGSPVVIGQVPLELMDFVVDPKRRQLVGNPEHGGQWMVDMF